MPRSKIVITEELAKDLEALTVSLLSKDGQEMFNPVPNKMPLENEDINLLATKRKLLGKELSHQAVQQGFESFEDANDFDVEDPYEKVVFHSKHEVMKEEEPDYLAKPEGEGTEPEGSETPEVKKQESIKEKMLKLEETIAKAKQELGIMDAEK